MKKASIIAATIVFTLFTYQVVGQPSGSALPKPNIIVILADDMGYSDLGCTGSEIQTPHLDQLAKEGVLFTHCYNTARCCPSRASLLTGLYQHRAGVGHMSQDWGIPAYQGHLNQQCVTIAEVLREKGYRTMMSGKWHVGGEREHWPDRRGFDQYFALPTGGGLYFYPSEFIDRPIYRNGELVTPDPETFYTTDNFTDEAIRFVEGATKEKEPFFLYLAHVAPHFPLQAWPEDIAKYQGKYDAGYEATRNQRFRRQQALGVTSTSTKLSPAGFPDWTSVEDPAYETRKMEIYAAQVDRLDQNVGRLTAALRGMDALDNTVILFLSDNGASSEEINRSHRGRVPDDEMGTKNAFVSYGKHWASVSNTPYRLYKSMTHEGGTITPMIVHWPRGGGLTNGLVHQPVHINDIMPTCLELAGAQYPERYQGRAILPMDGKSFVPALRGETVLREEPLFWEHEGNQAVREENMKLVRRHNRPWELYDLATDPTELNNLSETEEKTTERMERQYQRWMQWAGVQPWPVEKK